MDVDAGSTRSVQKIVMFIIVKKKDFVLFVSDFIHFTMFSSVMFSCYVSAKDFLSTTHTTVYQFMCLIVWCA